MKRSLKIVLCGLTALFLLGVGVLIWRLELGSWVSLDLLKITNMNRTTVLLDRNDKELAALSSGENRRAITLAEMPKYAPQAFIAAEDARFYEHHGIDLYRIGGALWSNLKSGGYGQGASTITQQLVKLTHLSNQKTLARKANEAVLAIQLEQVMSKDEILTAYLNTVYFGSGSYGIEAAARAYFAKPAKELTLSECALLAGIVKSPSNYAPHIDPDAALERRNLVLRRMTECGFIGEDEESAAKAEPLTLDLSLSRDLAYGFFVDAVIDEAAEVLRVSVDELMTGGYRIETTLDPNLQSAAEKLFQNSANFPANAEDGTLAQAALAAVEPGTGEVLCLVGGREYEVRRGLNRAAQSYRQPGSAIKPVSVYAAAVESGYLPSSLIDDTRREFSPGYSPKNAGGHYYGTVTLRTALSKSLNVATVDLADKVGLSAVRTYARRFRLPLESADSGYSLVLGALTKGVTPLGLATAYAAIASGGEYAASRCIRQIKDADGAVVYAFRSSSERILSEESAFLLTSMLQTAAESGSAKALSTVGFPVAGKTGTVEMETVPGNRDAWTCAYTPTIAVSVWMGFDRPDAAHCLSEGVGGSGYPARLAANFLKSVSSFADGGAFSMPDGLVSVKIDKTALEADHTPLLASSYTPADEIQTELFPKDAVPMQVSPYYQVPEKVDDLILKNGELVFTAREAGVDYLLMREANGVQERIALLSAEPGTLLRYTDETADRKTTNIYTVLPRHRALFERGRLLLGAESDPVYLDAEQSLFDRFRNWFSSPPPTAAPSPAETEAPLFSEE